MTRAVLGLAVLLVLGGAARGQTPPPGPVEPPAALSPAPEGLGSPPEAPAAPAETPATSPRSPEAPERPPELEAAIAKSARDRAEEVLFSRLSDEQAYALLELRSQPEGVPAVAIVAPVSFFLTVVIVVALVYRFRSRSERIRHETIRRAMDLGADIPPELLLPKGARRSDLRRGLVLTSGGLGLTAVLAALGEDGAWAVGIFPLTIGLGYLGFWWLDQRGIDGPSGPRS